MVDPGRIAPSPSARSRDRNSWNNGYFVAGGLKLTPDDRLCIPCCSIIASAMVMGISAA